jgi:hypothetical protein
MKALFTQSPRHVGHQLVLPSQFLDPRPQSRVTPCWAGKQAWKQERITNVPELLKVFRKRQTDDSHKHDYLLSNAALDTLVWRDSPGVQGGTSDRGMPATGQGPTGLT